MNTEQPPQAIIVCPHCQKEIELRVNKKPDAPSAVRNRSDDQRDEETAPGTSGLTVKQAIEELIEKRPIGGEGKPPAAAQDAKRGEEILRALVAKKMSDSNFQVPPMPHVAERILMMGYNAGSMDLAKIIANDQAITSNIMRIANSTFYGGVYKFETLPNAITRIGLDQVRILVLGFSMLSKEFAGGIYREECRRLNQHAVACAYLAALLAEITGVKEKEDAFLGGLLHDIGRLVIYTALEGEAQKQKKRSWVDREWNDEDLNAVLAEYHGNAGGFVATAWKLQPWLKEVIRHHHTFQQATERPRLVALVALANRYCHRFGLGCPEEEIDVFADGLGEAAHFSRERETLLLERLDKIKDLLKQLS
ncbi:MAG: HDOD domain-containing protein [Candidatus Manganitrophus sp.]|nr:HDOD domain-containing protein [Candidatus Manganitrophus sp.]